MLTARRRGARAPGAARLAARLPAGACVPSCGPASRRSAAARFPARSCPPRWWRSTPARSAPTGWRSAFGSASPSVVARVAGGRVLLDPRTLPEDAAPDDRPRRSPQAPARVSAAAGGVPRSRRHPHRGRRLPARSGAGPAPARRGRGRRAGSTRPASRRWSSPTSRASRAGFSREADYQATVAPAGSSCSLAEGARLDASLPLPAPARADRPLRVPEARSAALPAGRRGARPRPRRPAGGSATGCATSPPADALRRPGHPGAHGGRRRRVAGGRRSGAPVDRATICRPRSSAFSPQRSAPGAADRLTFPGHDDARGRGRLGPRQQPRGAAAGPAGRAPARVVLVLSNRPDAGGARARARGHGVPAEVLPDPADGADWLARLERHRVDLLVLAGYLKLVPPAVIAALPRPHRQRPPRAAAGVRRTRHVRPPRARGGARERRARERRHRPPGGRGVRPGRDPRPAAACPCCRTTPPTRWRRACSRSSTACCPAVVLAAAAAGRPVPLPDTVESTS